MLAKLRLDHVPFGVADAAAGVSAMEALGFVMVTGVCRWPMPAGTDSAASASVMFANTYLDLIAYAAPDWETRIAASPLYRRGLTPSGLVLGTDRFDADIAALRDEGHFALAPYAIERTLAGGAKVDYDVSSLGGPGRLPVSILADGAPRAMRTPAALDHPNTAIGLARAVVEVRDARAAEADVRRLARYVGVEEGRGPEVEFVDAPTDPLARVVSEAIGSAREVRLLVLVFDVQHIAAARSALDRAGVAFVSERGRVTVGPEEGFGCGLVFAEG